MSLSKIIKNVNIPAFLVLIIYPLVLIGLSVSYFQNHSFGSFGVYSFIIAYYISNISVGVGLHRLWSHNSYKINKYAELVLVILSAGTLQGPAIAWASDHHKHHSFTDTEQDPHSPSKYKNKIVGFLWSHIGWMLFGEPSYKSISKVTLVKLGKNKLLMWQLKYYWQLAVFVNVALPMLAGYLIGGSASYAYACFLAAGLGRAFQQQMTFCVNSACHFLGTQKYGTGTAGDIWWLFMFLLGENWHNFHHAFPSDYRNGVRWYHLDIHKWIIYGMYKIGLAHSLNRTSKERIAAKVQNTLAHKAKDKITKIDSLQTKIEDLIDRINNVEIVKKAEMTSDISINNLAKSAEDLKIYLAQITRQLKESIEDIKNSKVKNIIKLSSSKISNAEKKIVELRTQFDNILCLGAA